MALKPAAPKVTLRVSGKFAAVLLFRMAVNVTVSQAVSFAMASTTILSRAVALLWLRSQLAWQASQAASAWGPVVPASLFCS